MFYLMEGEPKLSGEEIKLALQVELNYFEAHKEEWLDKHKGKFLLIKGEELIDVFSSLDDAYKAGVKLYGNQPFFIKQLFEVDTTNQIPSLMLGIIHANLRSPN